MKNTNLNLVAGLLVVLQFFTSCSADFLEVDPKAIQIESSYYSNAEEAFNGLIAAYDPIGWDGAGGYGNIAVLNSASDDHFGGGGSASDVIYLNLMNSFRLDAANGPHPDFWDKNFRGISSTNTIWHD